MIAANVRADSIGIHGIRLTTVSVTMPRFLLSQFNTHRVFSRNAASSRAIPVAKLIDKVRQNPFVPAVFGANQKGMQAGQEIDDAEMARALWDTAKEAALMYAEALASLGVHKQLANRLLEPFAYVTVLVSATEWDNFFRLRLHHAAQPEMQQVAKAMRDAMDASTPAELDYGQWHIPFGDRMTDASLRERIEAATARCARISYESHDGAFSIEKDRSLHDCLLADGHLSPFEHCAQCVPNFTYSQYANYKGFASYRYIRENGLLGSLLPS